MSEDALKELLTNQDVYNSIRILRDGPLKEETISKFLFTVSKLDNKKVIKLLNKLVKEKIITTFTLGKEDKFYLLIKDFYVIRIPPKQLLEAIQKKSELPKSVRQKYLAGIKRYFSSYVQSTKKLQADIESNLVAILLDSELTNFMNFLKKAPIKLKVIKKKYPNFNKFGPLLQKYDIIEILSELGESWVFLKSDLHFNFLFPEYLIKSITEKLRDKKMEKNLALKSLYTLKRSYLESEKPEMYEDLLNRIQNKLELAKIKEKKGETPIDIARSLKKLYKSIGDYDNKKLWEKKLLEWQQTSDRI